MGDRDRSRSNSPPPARERPTENEEGKLFIGNLSYETTDRDLEDAFGKYGEVKSVRIITDRDTGRPRGFGFVTFADSRDADDAVSRLNGTSICDREIRVEKSTPRQPRDRSYGDRNGSRSYGDRSYGGDRNGSRGYGDRSYSDRGDRGRGYGDRGGSSRGYERSSDSRGGRDYDRR